MDKEQTAIARLREASEMSLQVYEKPLVVTTSGGKDSSVCVALAQRAGIPFEVLHSHTTADAPETVYFVRQDFQRLEESGIKCTIKMPFFRGKRTSMWELIQHKGFPPCRWRRYCCSVLKEQAGEGRFIITGVRWAESKRREGSRGIYETLNSDAKKRVILNNDNDDRRRLFETCTLKAKRACNPIIDWSDLDVWDYIRAENIPINPLYQCGFSRVGCIGCPLAGTAGRQREFARYPKYRTAYILAFGRMLEERKRRGFSTEWETKEEVFHWWMEDGVLPGQISLAELQAMEDDEDT